MKCAKGYFAILLMVLAIAALGLDTENAYAQDLIWQSDWTVPQSLAFGFVGYANSGANVVFSPDGEILFGAPSVTQWDDHFERLEGNGTIRWSVNIGGGQGSTYAPPMSFVANADGSAEVLASSGLSIAKIDADGSIAWSRSVFYASAVIGVSEQAVAVTDCNSVSLINTNTGQTTWQYTISQPTTNCPSPIAIADGSGNVYAVYSSYDPVSKIFNGLRCSKVDVNGKVVWDELESADIAVQPFGTGSGLVYLTQTGNPSTIIAVNASSGSIAWTAPGSGLGVVSASGEPIVSNAAGIQRLSAASGQPEWTQAVGFGVATVTGNDILLGSVGELARLDAGTGATVWSVTLPQTDSYGNSLTPNAVGEVAGPAAVAVMKPASQSAPPVLEKVDFATGQLSGVIPFPASIQGVVGNSVFAGPNGIATAAVALAPTGGQLRVRMLDVATGTTRWETGDSSTPVVVSPVATGVAMDGSTVAATVSNSSWSSPNSLGSVLADAFDMSTGTLRWSKTLSNLGQGFTYSFDPMVDPSGNVFVTYSAPFSCSISPLNTCGLQALVKLAASDGSIVWQFNNTGSPIESGGQVFPQAVAMQGSDMLLGGPFYGQNTAAALIRLSGVDGSTQWSSTVPTMGTQVSGIFPGTSSIIITGSGWAKIDAATGQVLWVNTGNGNPTCAAGILCDGSTNLRLASDDVMFGGEDGGHHAALQLLPAVQGGQAENFVFYPSEPQGFRSLVNQIVQDSANGLWLELQRHYLSGSGVDVGVVLLARFDPVSGELLSGQVIAPFDNAAVADTIHPLLMAPPENNQMPVQTYPYRPGAPDTTGNAMLNTAITANGDLALTATAEPQIITAGQTLTFQFTATYSGDASITGAHLMAALPWSEIPTNVTCLTQFASNCVVEANSDTIRASFDIQPGGQVTISGQIAVSSTGGTPMLQGVVYGPTGLNELNTTNNFGYLRVNDEIFKNGFE